MKKKILTIVSVILLTVGVGSAYASSAWQIMGYDYVDPEIGSDTWGANVYTSVDGGSMGVMVPDHAELNHQSGITPILIVRLYEDDGILGKDLVAERYYYPWNHVAGEKTYLTADFSSWEDGTNGKAEMIVRYMSNYNGDDFVTEAGD